GHSAGGLWRRLFGDGLDAGIASHRLPAGRARHPDLALQPLDPPVAVEGIERGAPEDDPEDHDDRVPVAEDQIAVGGQEVGQAAHGVRKPRAGAEQGRVRRGLLRQASTLVERWVAKTLSLARTGRYRTVTTGG